MDQNLRQQIVTRFHLDTMSHDEQEEIMADAAAIIMESVLTRTIPLLDESDGTQCDEMLAGDAPITQVYEFIKSRVPKFQEIVDSELDMLEKTLQ